jgi:hypothetical protein
MGIERAEHPVDRGVDSLVRRDLFRRPRRNRTQQIGVLLVPLLQVGVLHRRAEEAIAVETAEQRCSGHGHEQRQRERPLLGLFQFGHNFFRASSRERSRYTCGVVTPL